MKADIIFTTHDQEAIDQAEQLGMDKPEPTEEKGELYFKLELIDVAYLNDNGAIIICLPSGS